MFNLKQNKTAQSPYEKYHRDENMGPKADDDAPIAEKQLPHREGYEQTVTESQIKSEQEIGEKTEAKIVEKVLESADSAYVTHRSDAAELTVPPINALVEKIRQERVAKDYNVSKDPHWSHTFNEKKQQGSLPKWTKSVSQHDKPVLNNDPDRFSGSADAAEKRTVKPLIGDITTADVDRVAFGIKTGQAMEHDTAILSILRVAHDERRELNDVEQQTVARLKIARTKTLLLK